MPSLNVETTRLLGLMLGLTAMMSILVAFLYESAEADAARERGELSR